MTLRDLTIGHRKMFVFLVTILFLLVGFILALVFREAGIAIYGIYAGAVAGASGIFNWANVAKGKMS